MKEVAIPMKLLPLIQAFSTDTKSAKFLIAEALNPIDYIAIEGVIALMKSLSPKSTVEMVYAAQFIVSHFIGLRLLSQNFQTDQKLGLKLLKFSNKAMAKLQGEK